MARMADKPLDHAPVGVTLNPSTVVRGVEKFISVLPGIPAYPFIQTASVLDGAVKLAGFTYRGYVPWDKTEAFRPAKGRFRQQAEFILWGSKGAWHDKDGPTYPGVIRCGVMAGGPKLHTTGKPVPLMDALVQVCPQGTVLDPFVGSGTTGVAALTAGRRFVGSEREGAYYEIASERLSKAA
jgi:site-specific DNA-methyltransferase (adenine-specific)